MRTSQSSSAMWGATLFPLRTVCRWTLGEPHRADWTAFPSSPLSKSQPVSSWLMLSGTMFSTPRPLAQLCVEGCGGHPAGAHHEGHQHQRRGFECSCLEVANHLSPRPRPPPPSSLSRAREWACQWCPRTAAPMATSGMRGDAGRHVWVSVHLCGAGHHCRGRSGPGLHGAASGWCPLGARLRHPVPVLHHGNWRRASHVRVTEPTRALPQCLHLIPPSAPRATRLRSHHSLPSAIVTTKAHRMPG